MPLSGRLKAERRLASERGDSHPTNGTSIETGLFTLSDSKSSSRGHFFDSPDGVHFTTQSGQNGITHGVLESNVVHCCIGRSNERRKCSQSWIPRHLTFGAGCRSSNGRGSSGGIELPIKARREFGVRATEDYDGQGRRVSERATWGRVLVVVAFCSYLFLFVWKCVDTQLLYHGDMVVLTPEWWISFPWFQTGWSFFAEHLPQPGGMAKYVAALLAQFFFFPMAGALIFTLLGAGIYAGTVLLGRAMRTRGHWAAAYLSLLAVLGIASAYTFPLAAMISVMIALFAVSFYAFMATQRIGIFARCLTFTILCALIFWVVGGSCLVFAIGCGLIEWRQGKHGWLGLTYLVVACLVVLTGTYAYLVNGPDLGFHFTWRQLLDNSSCAAIPSAVFSGQIAVMLAWSWFIDVRARRAKTGEPTNRGNHDQLFRDTVAVALLAGIALLASFGLLDIEARPILRQLPGSYGQVVGNAGRDRSPSARCVFTRPPV